MQRHMIACGRSGSYIMRRSFVGGRRVDTMKLWSRIRGRKDVKKYDGIHVYIFSGHVDRRDGAKLNGVACFLNISEREDICVYIYFPPPSFEVTVALVLHGQGGSTFVF